MLEFLYQTILGRVILKILTWPMLSGGIGRFMDSRLSEWIIPAFIQKNNIDMSEYQVEEYRSFNDFFCRRIRQELRPIDARKDVLIAPCDGLLRVYPIQDDRVIPVKESHYRISDLLRDRDLAQKYHDGTCLVFRLCVHHYHRYCYPDSGIKTRNIYIPGVLHTVRPVALREVPVFTENSREYTMVCSDHFGDIIQMEVGAMLVGKIDNYHAEALVSRGEEKGRFLYGGSTIVLLLEKGAAEINSEILHATENGQEVEVKMGQAIGRRRVANKNN